MSKMAMLAEPRRKVKFSTDPRGSAWSKDENKFGQKLMEKMGWSKGKGLGVKENGKTDHISVSLKLDARGVGCSKSHVDNWIAHQDDFNALLSNLNQDHTTGNDGIAEESRKVLSLEETSRKSKGRVHYQKFTKGKDLSLKSASDLDCVLGKRKSQSGTNTPNNQSEANSETSDVEEQQQESDLKTVTSTDSIQEYFARKMAEKKAKLAGHGEVSATGSKTDYTGSDEGNNGHVGVGGEQKKKSKKEKRKLEADVEGSSKKMKIDSKAASSKKCVTFTCGNDDDGEVEEDQKMLTDTTDERVADEEMDILKEAVDGIDENMTSSKKKRSKKNKKKKRAKVEDIEASSVDSVESDKTEETGGEKEHGTTDSYDVNGADSRKIGSAIKGTNMETEDRVEVDAGIKKKKKKNKKKNKNKDKNKPEITSLVSSNDHLVQNKNKLSDEEVDKYGSIITNKLPVIKAVSKLKGKKDRSQRNTPVCGFEGANVDKVTGYVGMV